MGLPVCRGEGCAESDYAVDVQVSGAARDYSLEYRLRGPRIDPERPIVVESTCELCGLSEVEDKLAADLDRLCRQVEALIEAPTTVTLRTKPGGARLRVDGDWIGRSPQVVELQPGTHELEVRLPDHSSQSRTIEVVSGVPLEEEFLLLPEERPPTRRIPMAAGWVPVSAGLGLVVAGVTMIALDGNPYRGRCDGADVDVDGDCRFVHDTRTIGIGLTAAGAAFTGAGVGVVVWARRRNGQAGADSAGVTIRARF